MRRYLVSHPQWPPKLPISVVAGCKDIVDLIQEIAGRWHVMLLKGQIWHVKMTQRVKLGGESRSRLNRTCHFHMLNCAFKSLEQDWLVEMSSDVSHAHMLGIRWPKNMVQVRSLNDDG